MARFDVDQQEAARITAVVSSVSRVTVAQIMGWSRAHRHYPARQVAQYLILTMIGKGKLTAVSRYFECDHSTVRHNRLVILKEIETGGPRAGLLARCTARLDAGGDAMPFRKAPAHPPRSLPLSSPTPAIALKARPRPDYIPAKAKRITAAGWMDEDGTLVCRP